MKNSMNTHIPMAIYETFPLRILSRVSCAVFKRPFAASFMLVGADEEDEEEDIYLYLLYYNIILQKKI
jgi:hypothetical protein